MIWKFINFHIVEKGLLENYVHLWILITCLIFSNLLKIVPLNLSVFDFDFPHLNVIHPIFNDAQHSKRFLHESKSFTLNQNKDLSVL